MSNTRKMTEGSPFALIMRFALPLMIGNMLQQAYYMTDALIVSRTLGVTALAAIGASDWLSYMMISVAQAVTQGFAIMLAQDFGAQDHNHLQKALAHSIRLAVLITIVITSVSLVTMNPLLRFMHTKETLMPITSAYLGIIYAGLPAVMLLNFGSASLRAFGDSRTPLLTVVISASLNIILDLLFVMVFDWNVQGAALATVLAQLVAGIYCVFVLKHVDFIHLQKDDFGHVEHLDRDLMKLSWPLMAQNLVISLGGLVVQSQVNQYDLSFIAGYTATNKLYGMLEMAATAYGFAIVTYVGQNYGAGKYDRLRQGLKSSIIIGILTSALITASMILFGKPILASFLTGEASEVAAALATAYRFLVIMSVPLSVLYILYITRSFLQGIGNTLVPMISGVGECITRIVVAVFGGMIIGSDGSLFAEPAAWFCAMVILSVSSIHELGKLKKS